MTTGLPRAMVLRLIRALPGEPAFATVAFAKRLELPRDLAPALGAPGPHDFAVRVRAARHTAQPTSTAFRATFVTIAIRPLCRRGTGGVNINFRKNERRIFLREGLDAPNQLERTDEFRFFAQRSLAARAACSHAMPPADRTDFARRANHAGKWNRW